MFGHSAPSYPQRRGLTPKLDRFLHSNSRWRRRDRCTTDLCNARAQAENAELMTAVSHMSDDVENRRSIENSERLSAEQHSSRHSETRAYRQKVGRAFRWAIFSAGLRGPPSSSMPRSYQLVTAKRNRGGDRCARDFAWRPN